MNDCPIRLLHDPALDGPTNMARDEALLLRVGREASLPTLRLYQWNTPTISLGYFQRYENYQGLSSPAAGLPVVRRLTGGGAILHDLELTYSLTLPTTHRLLVPGPNRLYETVHDVVIACLAELGQHAARCGQSDDSGAAKGPFFCFARRHCYDVLVSRDKIAGSAQRRTRQAVLQHGSIILGNRFSQQPTATVTEPNSATALLAQYDELQPRVRAIFAREFPHVTGVGTFEGHWSAEELVEAHSLYDKYNGPSWTQRI